MQVFHTAGVPPNFGRIILAMIGSRRNNRTALTKSVTAKRTGKKHRPACWFKALASDGNYDKGVSSLWGQEIWIIRGQACFSCFAPQHLRREEEPLPLIFS